MEEMTASAGRYEIGRLLGSGATGDVFEAHDKHDGSRVVLKRFREKSSSALLRLKAEFRSLRDTYHPGLVRLFDLVVDVDAAFFTMEHVDGVDAARWAKDKSVQQVLDVMRRVAHALAFLHAQGKLHRDLKASNVLVDGSARARILDFGMVTDVMERPTLAGTLAYMAPELFTGAAASPASDWYAFGALLYQCLLGKLPIAGYGMAETIARKQAERFARPLEQRPEIGAEIDGLLCRLLAASAEARAHGDEVLRVLGEERADAPKLVEHRLLGRVDERALLDAAFDDAKGGSSRVVVIEGVSGIGKTALIRDFLRSHDGEATKLLGAVRPEEFVALRAFDGIVDQLAARLEQAEPSDREQARSLIEPALGLHFPVLAPFARAASALDGEATSDPQETPRQARRSLSRLLAWFATHAPVVVWIDDLQWADRDSLSLLEGLIADATGAPILFMLCWRPEASRERLPDWLASTSRLCLGPLDTATSLALIRHHGSELAPVAMQRAVVEAAGNAFLLELFARHLAGGAQAGTPSLADALTRALQHAGEQARSVFEYVVLSERALPLDWLGSLVSERPAFRDSISRLTAARLVMVDDQDMIRPYHDRLREHARASLGSHEARARHASLADLMIEKRSPLEWQIAHLEGAGRTAAAGQACFECGTQASARFALEAAIAYFRKSLELVPDDVAHRARALEKLADAMALAGYDRGAAKHYEEIATLPLPGRDSVGSSSLRNRHAVALIRSGMPEQGKDVLEVALHGVGESMPRSKLAAIFRFVYERVRLTLRGRAHRLATEQELSPRRLAQLDALWTSAISLSMYDPMLGSALTARFTRLAFDTGEAQRIVRALCLEAAFLAALGKGYRKGAEEIVADLHERMLELPWPYERAYAAGTMCSTSWFFGDLRACHEWGERGRELVRQVPGQMIFEGNVLDAFRIPVMSVLGQFERALAEARHNIASAEKRGDSFSALHCQHGHITLAYLANGELGLARKLIDRAAQSAERSLSPMLVYHRNWSLATVDLFERRGVDAHERLLAAWPALKRAGMLRLESVSGDLRYLRGRCAVAAAGQTSGTARKRRLADALAQAEWLRVAQLRYGVPFAEALEAQCASLRDDPAAAGLIARAAESLDELGLPLDSGALKRWGAGEAPAPVDAVLVPLVR
jgi:eukaryotic-like serine/threonine-protein kinase